MNLKYLMLFLIVFSWKSYAQNDEIVTPRLSTGVNMPIGHEFSEIYGSGLNANFILPFPIAKKLKIGPVVTLNYHLKYLNEAAKNQLVNYGVGLLFEYLFKPRDSKLNYSVGIRSLFENVNDKISPRKDYSGDVLKILSGEGLSSGLSFCIIMNRLVFEALYSSRNLTIKYDNSIDEEFIKYNHLYEIFEIPGESKMNFSSISISVGYKL